MPLGASFLPSFLETDIICRTTPHFPAEHGERGRDVDVDEEEMLMLMKMVLGKTLSGRGKPQLEEVKWDPSRGGGSGGDAEVASSSCFLL